MRYNLDFVQKVAGASLEVDFYAPRLPHSEKTPTCTK